MNMEKLEESLRKHEGLSLKPYKDTVGKLTIGFGKNLDEGITIQQAYALLALDIDTATKELDRVLPSWREHNDVCQNVLVEMVYNLGANRFLTFKKMILALRDRDYSRAAIEMMSSKWAGQVGKRAATLANVMETGEWPQ